MAAFDYGLALKLRPLKTTIPRDVIKFLDCAESYHDTLSVGGQASLVKFLVKTKIEGEPETFIKGLEIVTFEQLRNACTQKILALETVDELTRRITTTRQGRRTLAEYASQLNELAQRLAAATIKEDASMDKSTTTANCKRQALTQFKVGCHEEVKQVLAARMPTTMADALACASASGLDQTNSINTFGQYRRKQQKRYPNQQNFQEQHNQQQRQQYGSQTQRYPNQQYQNRQYQNRQYQQGRQYQQQQQYFPQRNQQQQHQRQQAQQNSSTTQQQERRNNVFALEN